MKKANLLLTVVTSLLLLTACGTNSKKTVDSAATSQSSTTTTATSKKVTKENNTPKKYEATFVNCLSGDTAKLKLAGKEQTLHYLMIQAPSVDETQPYADHAKNRGQELLSNAKKIEVELSESHQNTSDTKEAYIWLDGVLLQETLVKEGLAKLNAPADTNTTYLTKVRSAENEAKQNKLNIWSADNYVTNDGFSTANYNNFQLTKAAENALITAENQPNRENYQLAQTAIDAIQNGNPDFSTRLSTLDATLSAQEQAEQARLAEQQRVEEEQAAEAALTETNQQVVYITPTGKKYHSHQCGKGTYTESTLDHALSLGLTPCSKCY